ncbi:hypothetical protein V2G26_003946 [Clonostachys chloroleuca]
MILPRLSSSAITGSLDPSSHHLKETTAAASLHRAPYVATQPTTNPYIPARSVIPRTRSGGHSDGTHHSSIKTGRLGPRDPTSQHDGSSDKTALIIMGVFLGVGLLLSLLFLCRCFSRRGRHSKKHKRTSSICCFRGPKGRRGRRGRPGDAGSRGADGAPGPEGREGPPGAQGLRGDPGERGNKDPEGIQGSREIRGLPGRMARRALMAFRVAEDAEGAGDVKDAEEIQEKVALLERMAHRELMELQAPKDLEDLTELRAHRGSVGTHGRPSVEGRLEL